MYRDEVPTHWVELVANNNESTIDTNIGVANTWADDDFTRKEVQNDIDLNLVLTRSFKTPPPPRPLEVPQRKIVSF